MSSNAAVVGVGFNDLDEYLAELTKDRGRIERQILRITVRRRYGAPFVTVTVVATAVIGGRVVKLERLVGEAFAGDERADGLAAKTKAILDRLTEAGASLGLDVRAGVYE